jgi:beta-lactamase regulating signal transducer with metallopeptidase domain
MNDIVPLLSSLSAEATSALVSAVWEGTLLAIAVVLCLRLFSGLSAAARSVIWLNVFILLALLHLLPFVAGHQATPHFTSHPVRLDLRWSLAVAAVWLALSAYRAGQLIVSAIHLHALARRATAFETTVDLNPLLIAPGHRFVQLCASDEVARPSVLGFFRPRILVPPVLLEGLSEAELRQVVIHEMEHLRRGDDWTNLLQKLALVLFPLNLALLWVERRLCAERELACDDRVVLRSGSGRKAYALCLTHLAEYSLMRRTFSLVLGAWERRPELIRRVQRILSQPARTMGRKPALAVCSALIAGALVCTLTLAHAPELVSFVPMAQQTEAHQIQALPALDPDALAQALGGTPHTVKTIMPAQPRQRTIPAKLNCKRHRLPQLQTERLADLRIPPIPNSVQSTRAVMVMTEWTEVHAASQVTYTTSKDGFIRRPNAVETLYVVRTPNGWLIIQI